MNFFDLGLSTDTIKAMEELGITEPTTVQVDVIPSILQGKDIFTIAQTYPIGSTFLPKHVLKKKRHRTLSRS